jgi:hypothetical protein
MSNRIEWATLDDTSAELAPPEEYTDGRSVNDFPALAIGDGSVLEGPLDEWRIFTLALLDSVNEYEANEAEADAPLSVVALVTAVRAALPINPAEDTDDDVWMAARALVDALDPQPKEAQK